MKVHIGTLGTDSIFSPSSGKEVATATPSYLQLHFSLVQLPTVTRAYLVSKQQEVKDPIRKGSWVSSCTALWAAGWKPRSILFHPVRWWTTLPSNVSVQHNHNHLAAVTVVRVAVTVPYMLKYLLLYLLSMSLYLPISLLVINTKCQSDDCISPF